MALSSAVLGCPVDELAHTREEMLAEMVAAKQVLEEMLPREPLEVGRGRASGWLQPAQFVGGDCFDYFQAEDGIKFLLADAVGHGLSSTLMSLECRALWRALCRTRSLNETVAALNVYLSSDARGDERFVACCVGTFHPASGRISYICAGLAPCFHRDGGQVRSLSEADLPIGVVQEARFHERELHLEPGDCFLVATDGVAEWRNAEGQFFGEEQIMQSLRHSDRPWALLQRLQEFSSGYPQLDDAAVLALSMT